ncbi:MAG: hypothetical protein QOJ88_622, partial [Pyrinomonadaceae bacterium]|nr:hypothetical protein [Pyrinomonadaceae bacterium]
MNFLSEYPREWVATWRRIRQHLSPFPRVSRALSLTYAR